MSTVILPKILANFTTSLAATMSASATTCTLNVSVDGDGATLSGLYQATFDEGNASEEHMYVTFAGSSGTVSRRGLSKVDGWTEVAANKFRHERGRSVKLTNFSLILVTRLLNGVDTFNAVDWLGVNSISGLATPTSGETTKAASVAYVNAVSIAGASDASEVGKGLVEMGTEAQATSGTSTGDTGAPLTLTPARMAAQIQSGSWLYGVEDGTGSDDTYTWTTTPATSAYTTGSIRLVKFTVANTGACTGNENSIGAKTIKKYASGALADLETGDIVAGFFGMVYYDGTYLVLLNPSATMPTTALLSEMATFFGATDITSAEAETLTDGSDASTKHYHGVAILSATRAANTASGTQTIAHGLGRTPKYIEIVATLTDGNGSPDTCGVTSTGYSTGSVHACSYIKSNANGGSPGYTQAGSSSTKCVVLNFADTTTADATQEATAAFDDTNITLTWTLTSGGTLSNNMNITVLAH